MNTKSIYFSLVLLCCQILSAQQKTKLINNWKFLKQDIGGIWEAVRPVKQGNPEDVSLWTKVSLPHCAEDAVDPDINYCQGPSWYRTQLDIQNPYTNGRTLLHFERAGQKTDMRWGYEGEEKMIKVYSNCNEAELFVNGKSYGVKKRNSRIFRRQVYAGMLH